MVKKMIASIITAAIIIVLSVTLYLLKKAPATDNKAVFAAPEVQYVIGGETPLPVKAVKVSNSEGGFTLLAEEGSEGVTGEKYVMEGYDDFALSTGITSGVVYNSGRLAAKSIVAQPGTPVEPYGLERPEATVDITLTDGTKTRFFIGGEAPGNEGRYVSNDSGTVYLVDSYSVSGFLAGAFEFMDKTVVPAALGDALFESAILKGSLRPEQIEITKDAAVETTPFYSHKIIQPFTAVLDREDGMPILLSAFGLTAEKVVSTSAELEKFGLDEPYSILELVPDTETGIPPFTLSATCPDAEGKVYISSSLSEFIFRHSADAIGWLEVTAYDLMVKQAVLPQIDTVSKVSVDTAENNYVFILNKEEDGELTVVFDGTEINADNFRKYYQSLIAAGFDSIPDESLPENPVLLLSYTYEYNTPEKQPDVVRFYEGSARRAYIALNDGPYFCTSTAYIDKVIADVNKLIMGETVTPYL